MVECFLPVNGLMDNCMCCLDMMLNRPFRMISCGIGFIGVYPPSAISAVVYLTPLIE